MSKDFYLGGRGGGGGEINYMFENNILRNHLQKVWVSWGTIFDGLGVWMMPKCPVG